MNTTEIYREATRRKLRYPFNGRITTEDLWDLNLEQLNQVYADLAKEREAHSAHTLFQSTGTATDKDTRDLEIKIEIVRDIFATKQAEIERRKLQRDNLKQREKLLDILAQKQNEELMSKTPDEIQAMIDALI